MIYSKNTILKCEGRVNMKISSFNYDNNEYIVYLENGNGNGFGITTFSFNKEFIEKNYMSKQELRLRKLDRIING